MFGGAQTGRPAQTAAHSVHTSCRSDGSLVVTSRTAPLSSRRERVQIGQNMLRTKRTARGLRLRDMAGAFLVRCRTVRHA